MINIANKSLVKNIAIIAFVAIIVSIPWEDFFYAVNNYRFIDKGVYEEYFLYRENVIYYKEFGGILSYISNEFLWNYSINWLVNNLNIPIEYIFNFISIFVIFVFSAVVARYHGVGSLLLLVNPLVIDFAFSQYRLAFAIAILGVAWLVRERRKAVALILMAVSIFIHTAVVIFLAIYFMMIFVKWISLNFDNKESLRFFALLFFGVFVSILIGPLRESVLSTIGDRRAQYNDISSSLMYLLFWVGLLLPFYLQRKNLMNFDYSCYALAIVSIVFANIFTGAYSTRFIAAAFPLIVSSILSLRGMMKLGVVTIFVIYTILQWLYWFRIMGG